MFFKKLFKKEPPQPPEAPPPPPPPTAAETLAQAVSTLAQQDKHLATTAAQTHAQQSAAQKKNAADFLRLRDAVILPVFNEAIALFEKHGSRAHLGKTAGEEWAGESVKLNLYGKAEYKGPSLQFSLPDSRNRLVTVTKTLVDAAVTHIELDVLDADRVRHELAGLVEAVRQHRKKN